MYEIFDRTILRDTMKALPNYKYVFKSDVKNFYDSMNHQLLLITCRSFKVHPHILQLIKQSLGRVEECNTHCQSFQQGIPRGSLLSPLLGTVMLHELDKAMEKIPDVYYRRYMDDWVVLCNKRSTLRKIIKIIHRLMSNLKLELHPDKTYFGRIDKGFDFLGYRLSNQSIAINDTTLHNFRTQLQQRYAQEASSEELAGYVRQFTQWCRAGIATLLHWNDEQTRKVIDAIFFQEKEVHEGLNHPFYTLYNRNIPFPCISKEFCYENDTNHGSCM